MSMIEGIGDEVLQFFGFVLISLIGVVAWWSTGIRERPQIRTVLILEHRSPNAQISSSRPTSAPVERNVTDTTSGVETETTSENDGNSVTDEDQSRVDSPVTSPPATAKPDKDLIKERRLAYFQSQEDTKASSSENSPTESTQEEETSSNSSSPDNIRIRLKYLNDDQKLVEGRLQELLGDFKRRHFSGELSADKLVRLIFNGQVLQCDDQTLQGYGLYDNCVVHCLIHAQRSNLNRANAQPQGNATPPECNLGLLLYASVSVILGLAWFFRYHYSQFFTITTTAGLVALTALFAVLIVGLHMQDQETVPTW